MRQRSFVFLQHDLITLSCQGLMKQQELAPIYRNVLYIVLHYYQRLLEDGWGSRGPHSRVSRAEPLTEPDLLDSTSHVGKPQI